MSSSPHLAPTPGSLCSHCCIPRGAWEREKSSVFNTQTYIWLPRLYGRLWLHRCIPTRSLGTRMRSLGTRKSSVFPSRPTSGSHALYGRLWLHRCIPTRSLGTRMELGNEKAAFLTSRPTSGSHALRGSLCSYCCIPTRSLRTRKSSVFNIQTCIWLPRFCMVVFVALLHSHAELGNENAELGNEKKQRF